MSFPVEILTNIVECNEDSVGTLISWAHISNYYKHVISHRIGIVTVVDGPNELQDILGYQILVSTGNHVVVSTDQDSSANAEILKGFCPLFGNLLLVVDSQRRYSEVLSNLLGVVAHSCQQHATVSVLYRTRTNFLSKLYFAEFKRCCAILNLAELYVIGENGISLDDTMCDIENLFARVYLNDVESIYSLDLLNARNPLIAPGLEMIKNINFDSQVVRLDQFLGGIPNLKYIGSVKFPLGSSDCTTYVLPACDVISFTEFNSGVAYPIIDGKQVRKEVAITTSLRTRDPEFTSLCLPQVETMTLSMPGIASYQWTRFQSCQFGNLMNLNCDAAIIPWEDLSFINGTIKHLSIKLYSKEQLEWLESCPFIIKDLEIFSNRKIQMGNEAKRLFNVKASSLTIKLESLEQFKLFQDVIVPLVKANNIRHLNITVGMNSLLDSVTSSVVPRRELGLESEDSTIISRLPPLESLTILSEERDALDYMGLSSQQQQVFLLHQQRRRSSATASENILKNIPNMVDCGTSSQMCGMSFFETQDSGNSQRKLSMSGVSSSMASQNRKRHSSVGSLFSNLSHLSTGEIAIDDNDDEVIVFEPAGSHCGIVTTNINALESCMISLKSFVTLPLLRVLVMPEEEKITGPAVSDVGNRIIDLLHYPYRMKFPTVYIKHIQIMVDFKNKRITNTVGQKEKEQFLRKLGTYLESKGCVLPVLTNLGLDQTSSKVEKSVLINF
ncbi:uncharacterized protein KNAG_0I00960 [Huiozyma naganishii CBS 8797]|uniref:Uncharacterized protein n=1 Tax=Huiozyma naganishii (strain ATCC MYA-139 / BCRC 22969 / CBS 8797 / KCTC 17520 / NBRC 10181 / NCYC 3082 / Yp74L-3) TaxID=1071383 RepID=J7S281_HUIN7|nr:hypothetical protein KNAG_0I00960 [Kazachstania naganishii CBS 8797]CCK71887.1 hypothetical protein KNAG_0I00960 [Kazachstania naganishii CBS 8797]